MIGIYRLVCYGCLLALCVTPRYCWGQGQASEQDGFDIASIRINKSGGTMLALTPTANGYEMASVSLSRLLSTAYDLRQDQIAGLPSWATSTTFDVSAKASSFDPAKQKPLTLVQHRKYLAALLVERFSLATHITTQSLPVFKLVLAASEPKFSHSTSTENGEDARPSMPHGDILVTNWFMRGKAVPVSSLAKSLAYVLGRDVIDETGCKGFYDISLQWVPPSTPNPNFDDPDVRSAIFTALKDQLGLKLQSAKGPVEVLVVDHVRMPTAN